MKWYSILSKKRINDFETIARYIFNLDVIKSVLNQVNAKVEIYKAALIQDNSRLVYGRYHTKKHSMQIFINSHIGKSLAFFVDTIAHELAHIAYQEHSKDHTRLKNKIKIIIKYEIVQR